MYPRLDFSLIAIVLAEICQPSEVSRQDVKLASLNVRLDPSSPLKDL